MDNYGKCFIYIEYCFNKMHSRFGSFKICTFKRGKQFMCFYEKLFYLNFINKKNYNYILLFKMKTNIYS